MAKVAIDGNGRVLAVWNDTPQAEDLPPSGKKVLQEEDDQRAGLRVGLPDMGGEARVIDVPQHDSDSFVREADTKAGGKAGRMWLRDESIEAEPAGDDPETAVEGALLGIRKSVTERGGSDSLRVEDIDRAIERERGKGRSR